MNKSELVEAVQKSLGNDATKRCAEDALAAVLGSIATGVKKDGVKIETLKFYFEEGKKDHKISLRELFV